MGRYSSGYVAAVVGNQYDRERAAEQKRRPAAADNELIRGARRKHDICVTWLSRHFPECLDEHGIPDPAWVGAALLRRDRLAALPAAERGDYLRACVGAPTPTTTAQEAKAA